MHPWGNASQTLSGKTGCCLTFLPPSAITPGPCSKGICLKVSEQKSSITEVTWKTTQLPVKKLVPYRARQTSWDGKISHHFLSLVPWNYTNSVTKLGSSAYAMSSCWSESRLMSHQMNQALASSHITSRSSDGKGEGGGLDAASQASYYHSLSLKLAGVQKSTWKSLKSSAKRMLSHTLLLPLQSFIPSPNASAGELGPAVEDVLGKVHPGANLCFPRIIYQSLCSFPGSAWSVTFAGTHVERPTSSFWTMTPRNFPRTRLMQALTRKRGGSELSVRRAWGSRLSSSRVGVHLHSWWRRTVDFGLHSLLPVLALLQSEGC